MFNELFIWIQKFREAGLLGFCFLLFQGFLIQIGEADPFPKVEKCLDSNTNVLFLQETRKDAFEVKYKSFKKINLARMLIKMLDDPELKKLFPLIDTNKLIQRVKSTDLPVYDVFSDRE